MVKITEAKLTDFTPDPGNANLGTQRGQAMLEDSIREDGAARSIVVDADNIVVAGNKTHQGAVDAGIEKAVVVEVEGNELVVVKRTDFNLDGDDGRARRYAYRDNRSSEINLAWDAGQLLADLNADVDLSGMFTDFELEDILGEAIFELEDETELAEKEARQTLAERFIVPPFSVLDARQGYWQERKRAWIALGIRGELGRGEDSGPRGLLDFSAQVNMSHSGTPYNETPRHIPGQSSRERERE